jgi:hypothetical protein
MSYILARAACAIPLTVRICDAAKPILRKAKRNVRLPAIWRVLVDPIHRFDDAGSTS